MKILKMFSEEIQKYEAIVLTQLLFLNSYAAATINLRVDLTIPTTIRFLSVAYQ